MTFLRMPIFFIKGNYANIKKKTKKKEEKKSDIKKKKEKKHVKKKEPKFEIDNRTH